MTNKNIWVEYLYAKSFIILSSLFLHAFIKIRNFKVRSLFNTVNNSHITYWFKTNTYTLIGSGMLLATCNALYIAISQSFKT